MMFRKLKQWLDDSVLTIEIPNPTEATRRKRGDRAMLRASIDRVYRRGLGE